MTSKAHFNAEQWSAITSAPYLAGLSVLAADRGGTLRETMALSNAYARARAHYDEGLLREIVSTPPAVAPASGPLTPEDVRRNALTTLRRALAVLAAAAPEAEIDQYKRFVYFVAEEVAQAHREGGFLGLGGREISEAEQSALDEIAAILDAPAGQPNPE